MRTKQPISRPVEHRDAHPLRGREGGSHFVQIQINRSEKNPLTLYGLLSMAKIFILNKERYSKISYERHVYESVDDESLF